MPLFATNVKQNNNLLTKTGSKTYSMTVYLTVQRLDTFQSVKCIYLLLFVLVKGNRNHLYNHYWVKGSHMEVQMDRMMLVLQSCV